MGRKRNTESEGLAAQAEAVRDMPDDGRHPGGIITNDAGETGPADGTAEPAATEPVTNGDGDGNAPGPPRLNPPRYWLAVRDPQGGLTLIREFKSLRAAMKEFDGAVRMARMFAAGAPVIVKVKVAHPLPAGAGSPG